MVLCRKSAGGVDWCHEPRLSQPESTVSIARPESFSQSIASREWSPDGEAPTSYCGFTRPQRPLSSDPHTIIRRCASGSQGCLLPFTMDLAGETERPRAHLQIPDMTPPLEPQTPHAPAVRCVCSAARRRPADSADRAVKRPETDQGVQLPSWAYQADASPSVPASSLSIPRCAVLRMSIACPRLPRTRIVRDFGHRQRTCKKRRLKSDLNRGPAGMSHLVHGSRRAAGSALSISFLVGIAALVAGGTQLPSSNKQASSPFGPATSPNTYWLLSARVVDGQRRAASGSTAANIPAA